MVGAEEAMAADQVVWSEQGRLHLAATTVASAAIAADDITFASAADANMFRVNDTVLLYCTVDGTTASNVGTTIKCLVTDAADSVKRTVIPYTQPTLDSTASGAVTYTTASVFRVMVYGSEYAKGSTLGTDRTTLTPTFKSFSNKPIILRDRYQVVT